MPHLQRKVRINWSRNFAYAIGLLTSDGGLSNDKRHIYFVSSDRELIDNLKISLSLMNKVGRGRRGTTPKRWYWTLQFGDKVFYKFLNKLGLTSGKSKNIQKVTVPSKYFGDFLRGLFDGDGTFYTFWDKRWPNSFGYQIAFASASPEFIRWLRSKLENLYGVKGVIHRGDGVLNLRYVKGYTRTLFSAMYQDIANILFLRRKYFKIMAAFERDKKLHPNRKHAGVAQW